MRVSEAFAYHVIAVAQRTPFRGTELESKLSSEQQNDSVASCFPQAYEERRRADDFFEFFPEALKPRQFLSGKTVLDFGCGYGGRTVAYAERYNAEEVIGVEVFRNVVGLCQEFAAHLNAHRCQFLLSTQESIPLPDSSIDIVVSYDVFEHVEDPQQSAKEIHRVLKPGGKVLVVFTPFYGAFSHHLNFATRLPGLHWIFRPQTLVAAVNRFQHSHADRATTKPLPPPLRSYGNRRWSIPTINGMTSQEFLSLLKDFNILYVNATPLLSKFRILGRLGAMINGLFSSPYSAWGEAVSFNLVCILEKPH
jgi:ubiquinone/menaquinone biosynthesis C-methylase UbiE